MHTVLQETLDASDAAELLYGKRDRKLILLFVILIIAGCMIGLNAVYELIKFSISTSS